MQAATKLSQFNGELSFCKKKVTGHQNFFMASNFFLHFFAGGGKSLFDENKFNQKIKFCDKLIFCGVRRSKCAKKPI